MKTLRKATNNHSMARHTLLKTLLIGLGITTAIFVKPVLAEPEYSGMGDGGATATGGVTTGGGKGNGGYSQPDITPQQQQQLEDAMRDAIDKAMKGLRTSNDDEEPAVTFADVQVNEDPNTIGNDFGDETGIGSEAESSNGEGGEGEGGDGA